MDVEAESPSSSFKPTKPEDRLMMTSASPNSKRSRRKSCICLSVIALILALGFLFLILGLTVLKVKRPRTTVDFVSLQDLDFSLDIARLRVRLNVTLDLGISLTNPNRVGFKYTNSTAFLRYRAADVGEVPISAGKIGARDTHPLNLTLTLMADRLLFNSALYTDVVSGTLPFQTYVRIPGKVRLLFNIHVITYTTCDLEISLANRTVSNQKCHYKAKL
ncbi:hypothetical protein OROGR_014784 [Orobanche gracilis]